MNVETETDIAEAGEELTEYDIADTNVDQKSMKHCLMFHLLKLTSICPLVTLRRKILLLYLWKLDVSSNFGMGKAALFNFLHLL